MIAVVDIFQLSPGFRTAVVNVHDVLMGCALIVCFAGLGMVVAQAQRERNVGEIMPALIRITLISVFLTNMGAVSDFLGDMVTDIEQAAGVGGNPMQAFVAAIKAKFGVDPTADFGSIAPAGQTGPTQAGSPIAGTNLTHYAYPGDTTPAPWYDQKSPDKAKELAEKAGYKNEKLIIETNSNYQWMRSTMLVVAEQLKAAGIDLSKQALLTISVTEDEIDGIGGENIAGAYACMKYFQSLDNPNNKLFVPAFKKMWGEKTVIGDVTQAAYLGPWLWKLTAEKAGSFDIDKIAAASPGIEFKGAPEGYVRIHENHHLWSKTRVGRAKLDGQFDLVFETADLVEPDPFPKGYQ